MQTKGAAMKTKVIPTIRTDGGWQQEPFADQPPLTEEQKLNKLKANAIREAADELTVNYWIDYNDLADYADKLERGEL